MKVLSILRTPKTLASCCFFIFFGLLTGCGTKDPAPPPAAQKTTTDQIVVLQTGGGTTGSGIISGVKISAVSLPQPLFQSTAVTYTAPSGQSYIYVLGGAYYDFTLSPDPINVNTVYSTRISPDGSLSPIWNVENSRLPFNLRGHSSVIYNNAIYVMGGIGSGGFQKAIYRAAITWDNVNSIPVLQPWAQVGSLPVEETGQAAVVSGNMLYVIGGVESGLPPPDCSPNCVGSQSTVFSDKIYGYNLSMALTSVSIFTMPKKLYTPAAAADVSHLWVMGGWEGTTNSNTVYTYDVSGGALTCNPSSCIPGTLPGGVGISKAASLYLPDILEIFLLGGVSGDQNTPEVIRQDVFSSSSSSTLLTWTQETSLPLPVVYFAATSAQGAIFIMGGLFSFP
ncbi:MAG: Kelch repeat-containing protein [Nitrospiria bacterium]